MLTPSNGRRSSLDRDCQADHERHHVHKSVAASEGDDAQQPRRRLGCLAFRAIRGSRIRECPQAARFSAIPIQYGQMHPRDARSAAAQTHRAEMHRAEMHPRSEAPDAMMACRHRPLRSRPQENWRPACEPDPARCARAPSMRPGQASARIGCSTRLGFSIVKQQRQGSRRVATWPS
jgi:hypothetical protein